MKKLLLTTLSLTVLVSILFAAIGGIIDNSVPRYSDALGDDNYIEKILGIHLVKESAARDDNIIIYGSSELRTLDISTHPVNFFADKRTGFQVNLVGRGSCQSLIHAINIASTGDSLAGKKVVLITSPQSYVEGGIAPDLFAANFSELQYMELMLDPSVSDDIKEYISLRVHELIGEYAAITGNNPYSNKPADLMSNQRECTVGSYLLRPYYRLSRRLLSLKDKISSGKLIARLDADAIKPPLLRDINWGDELEQAVLDGVGASANNDFGMLDDYYTTYVGRKLAQMEGKEADLSYSISKEYGDLKVLLDICKLKGIEPLFVHVPMHGAWSDFTGFSADRREEYYGNVRDIVGSYDNVQLVDLTEYEYEEYFLCDVMHLGWKGWLEVDKAIDEYFKQG